MKFNVHKLTRAELAWLASNTCKAHRVSYLSHPNCYYIERPDDSPIEERVGFLDIESTHLKASFGYCLSYYIKTRGKDELLGRVLTSKEITSGKFDQDLLKEFIRDALTYDRLCVYWGRDRRHDIPFLRTRALKFGISFPLYKDIYVTDVYDMTKNKLSLHSYRLQAVCDYLGIPAKQHPLSGEIWLDCSIGKQYALDWVRDHNIEDVTCLEPVYNALEPYFRGTKVSI